MRGSGGAAAPGEKEQIQRELADARRQCEGLAGAPQALAWAERREACARTRRPTGGAGVEGAGVRAGAGPCWPTSIANSPRSARHRPTALQTPRNRPSVSRSRMPASGRAAAGAAARRSTAALARLDQLLAALPAAVRRALNSRPLPGGERARAKRSAAAERRMLAAVRDAQALEELAKQSATLAARREKVQARCINVENELANWNLLARCMSNDGADRAGHRRRRARRCRRWPTTCCWPATGRASLCRSILCWKPARANRRKASTSSCTMATTGECQERGPDERWRADLGREPA